MLVRTLGTLLLIVALATTASAQNGISGGVGAPPPYSFPNGPQNNPNLGNNPMGLNNQPSARIAANPTNNIPTIDSSRPAMGGTTEAQPPAVAVPSDSIFSLIRQGGVLMIPILGCSVILVVFIFERLVFLRRGRVIPKPFVRGVIEQLEQQQLDQEEAIALCEENGSPIAELFGAALKKWGRPAVEIEQAVVDAGARVTSKLKRYFRLFSSISNVSPLLGLLGTVQGMIEAFNSIAHNQAMGRPEMLAGSIGLALVTTAAGLCVAIPAYIAYAFFLGRVDKLILEMDSHCNDVIEAISAEAQSNRSRSRSRKAA